MYLFINLNTTVRELTERENETSKILLNYKLHSSNSIGKVQIKKN